VGSLGSSYSTAEREAVGTLKGMDFDDFEQDISAWGAKPAAPVGSGDVIKDAIRKEQVIKSVLILAPMPQF
jgi:hypothetical protein